MAEAHPEATIVRTSLIYGGTEPGPQERLARENRRFFVDEIRCPVHVGDLAAALLELLVIPSPGRCTSPGRTPSPGSTSPSCSVPTRRGLEAAHTTPDRAPDVSLDSSRAAALLSTRVRGVYEVLDKSSAVRRAR